jgi:DNA adenine methylase Dam
MGECENYDKDASSGTSRKKETPITKKNTLSLKDLTMTSQPIPLDSIVIGDCIKGMSILPDNSFDLAIADPPYNLSKGGVWKWDSNNKLPGFGGDWQKVMETWDDMSLRDYFAFTVRWLSEVKRLVKPPGSLWIHGTYHNIGVINVALQLLGIEIINEVIWYKRNSFPNLSGRRLTASHETILWAHTGSAEKRLYLFNYNTAKNTSFPEDGLKEKGKQMRTVWDIPNNKDPEEIKYGKHPTQKPIRLLTRMIQLSARPGHACLIPFAGAGSECVAAKRCGLNFLAFETDQKFVQIAADRISNEDDLFSNAHDFIFVTPRPREEEIEKLESKNRAPDIPSLIKWTGSKRSQAARIFALFPPFERYFEPFLGGGALLYLIDLKKSFAGDIHQPLIEFWKLVQTNPDAIIAAYAKDWQKLQNDLPGYFYKVRDRFNSSPNPFDLSFLARTCVNGIIRFNKAGKFNNSFHLSRRGMEPDRFARAVHEWHLRIRNTTFRCCDFEELLEYTRRGDFAYLDPPYAGSRNRFVANIDQDRLYRVLDRLSTRGVKWAMSFDGTRGNTDLRSPLPDGLYKRHIFLSLGHSYVKKVLSGSIQQVRESLYLNY